MKSHSILGTSLKTLALAASAGCCTTSPDFRVEKSVINQSRAETAQLFAESESPAAPISSFAGTGIGFSGMNNDYVIRSVQPDSDAAKAGINPGDVLRAVDGIAIDNLDANVLESILRAHAKEEFSVTIDQF